jgi:hypothetical protein
MKIITVLRHRLEICAALLLISSISYSQDYPENLFKYPMEMDRTETQAKDLRLQDLRQWGTPVNTSPTPTPYFNINITQQAAPQNEPSVCISRKSPNRVVAAWRDFRYGVDPNANRRVGYSYSTNGGLTWSVSQILDSTILPGLTRNSDPVVTVDTAGNFYISVIAISPSGSNLTLGVYKSTNGGVTFPNAYIASQTGLEDKEWITTDLNPASPYLNSLYIAWMKFSGSTGIHLVKSSNGGINWTTPPVRVSEAAEWVQGANVCVSPNGQVDVVWLNYGGTNADIMFDRSTNGGTTFGTDILVSSGTFFEGLPNDVGTFPFIAADNSTGPRSGWLYCVFADNRNGDCDVFLSRSTNAGLSWSAAVRVNNDAMSNGKIQYWPVVAVNEYGTIAVMFMDTRNTPDNTIIEAWLALSYDGGFTFSNEVISSDQSPTNIPGSNVRFGDYVDIDVLGTNVVPVWTDERMGGFNMEIYTAEIGIPVGIEPVAKMPLTFHLGQNYPNPFNSKSKIKYQISKMAEVTLAVYDLLGREARILFKGVRSPGAYEVSFDASNLPSGVYFYTLRAGEFSETKKMVLVR